MRSSASDTASAVNQDFDKYAATAMLTTMTHLTRRLLLLSPTLLIGLLTETGSAGALAVGKAAPTLTAQLIDGSRYSLADQRDHVVIINFWATWCEPCTAELAAFKAYAASHPDAPLRILAVSVDDPERRGQVQKIAQTLGFPVAMYDDIKAPGYGRIWRLPMSFVVDRAGVLRVDGGVGEQKPYDAPLLERGVTPLWSEPASVQKE